MSRSPLAALACAGLAAASTSLAHPPGEGGHGPLREWTNARTGERIEGSFLSAREGSITIETSSGGVAALALSELAPADREYADARIAEIRAFNEWRVAAADVAAVPAGHAEPPVKGPSQKPAQAAIFDAFGPFVRTRFDDRWLYIESDGLPHAPLETRMMVGIRSWQQQVPLPQPYTGANAWQIPLRPELADKPVLGRTALMRGAVALAANGIPIFNALNNGGRDSFLIGELDEYGGHCGRGDDYHYHAAPLAIERIVGKGKPIAYALDGFPIYGLFDPKARDGDGLACPLGSTEPLDEINGHFCEVPKGEGILGSARSYHYHASKSFPYINGGLRGKAEIEGSGTDTQVVPQPRAAGVRPALPPLRGASITGFEQVGPKAWSLRYEIGGKASFVNYRIEDGGKVIFEFVGPDGDKRVEEHLPRARGGRGDRAGNGGPGGPPRDDRAGQGGRQRGGGDGGPRRDPPPRGAPSAGLALTSTGVGQNGLLDAKHTCDGAAVSPPLAWTGVPPGTRSIAVTIHHMTPDGLERVYLVRYGIPAGAASVPEGDRSLGRFGLNNVGRRPEYAPPCSQGPGEKTYIATVYALSAEPTPASATPTRDELLAAMKGITLATGTLEMRYARPEGAAGGAGAGAQRGDLLARMTAFKTEVPAHDHSVVLVRPERTSATASVVAATGRLAWLEYWRDGGTDRRRTPTQQLKPGVAAPLEMTGLEPGSAYRYRLMWRDGASSPEAAADEETFETPRRSGVPFTFAIQADSHLDQGVDLAAYAQTLSNIKASGADFLVDLGDTFMVDKRGSDYERAEAQYDAQHHWFGIPCGSMPLLMVLGNHDGERGIPSGRDGDIAEWSYRMRTSRFPPPVPSDAPGAMYSGRTSLTGGAGANYYAFEWGDALLVVLDPFWSTTERIRGGGGGGNRGGEAGGGRAQQVPLAPVEGSWSSTLGRAQYDWLGRTLERSKALHKFVFIHHLVGGMGGAESRGGVESAPYFEWGGKDIDGTDRFAERRAGWPMPIHSLLVKHGVSAVFHGHDHLYVHSTKDGIHYQCVPQPGNLAGGTRSAAEYGYASGNIKGSPGHLRVKVGPGPATVEFVRTAPDGAQAGQREGRRRGGEAPPTEANGAVVDRYDIAPTGKVAQSGANPANAAAAPAAARASGGS